MRGDIYARITTSPIAHCSHFLRHSDKKHYIATTILYSLTTSASAPAITTKQQFYAVRRICTYMNPDPSGRHGAGMGRHGGFQRVGVRRAREGKKNSRVPTANCTAETCRGPS